MQAVQNDSEIAPAGSITYILGQPGTRRFAPAEYELAFRRVAELAAGAVAALEGVTTFFRPETSRHAGPVRTLVSADEHIDKPMSEYAAGASISIEAIKNGDVDAAITMLTDHAHQQLKQWAPSAFQFLFDVAKAKGAITNETIKENVDAFYDGLSKADIEFDEDGHPNLTFGTHPDAAEAVTKMLEESEKQPRFRELLERKKEEFFARKRRRRLS